MRRLSREKKLLFAILAFGLILRLSFILFGAEIYFSRENIFTDKDTGVWKTCITNLIETGAYTLDHEHEYGPFARMPGYGFFMGFFWLLCGQNWNLAFHVIGWTQLFLDIICIYLVYCIARSVFQRGRPAYIAAFLYACYPFIIVWNPVVYSESLSVFFGMLCLYFLLTKKRSVFLLASGVCLGLAALNRPQFILMAPVALLYLSMKSIRELKLMIIRCLIFSLGFLVMYGSWPLRNYINYGKVIITQDLRAIRNWDVDVIAFMNYIYSVKAEWEPQFSNIIHNKKVEFPELAYISPQDSLMLEKAVALSKTCGKGFSYWIGYWKEPIENEGCTKEIETLFTALRDNQIKTNPLNFYLFVPLQNLKKALFKTTLLYDTGPFAKVIGSGLFIYRTILIIIGIFGSLLMIYRKIPEALIFILFFAILYLLLCFGTTTQARNIEIRYFLQADIMLLFPAAALISIVSDILKIIPSKIKLTGQIHPAAS